MFVNPNCETRQTSCNEFHKNLIKCKSKCVRVVNIVITRKWACVRERFIAFKETNVSAMQEMKGLVSRLVMGVGLRDGAAGAACELTTGGDHPPGRLDGRTLWPGMATRLRRDVWVEQCEERGVRGVRLVALGDRRGGQVRPLLWGLHLEGEKVCVKSKSLALDNRTESLWPFLSSA